MYENTKRLPIGIVNANIDSSISLADLQVNVSSASLCTNNQSPTNSFYDNNFNDNNWQKKYARNMELIQPNINMMMTARKSANRTSDLSEFVARSKSFQEPGVRLTPHKTSRYFIKRVNSNCKSDFSLDTISQNIEITIQDADGNFKDNQEDLIESRTGLKYDQIKNSNNSRHILARILRRMRKFSFGWKKSRCRKLRGEGLGCSGFCIFIFLMIYFALVNCWLGVKTYIIIENMVFDLLFENYSFPLSY